MIVETYLHVREDAMQLYGFAERAERELFVQLLSVNGIGPKVALAIVSGSPAEELRRAIVREDAARFQAIPGIGKKTAERIVLELKEKLGDDADRAASPRLICDDHVVARNALVELGYSLLDAERALAETDRGRCAGGARAAGVCGGRHEPGLVRRPGRPGGRGGSSSRPSGRAASTTSSGRSASRSSSRSRSPRRRRAGRRSTTCCSPARRASARRASRTSSARSSASASARSRALRVEKKDIAAILTSLEARDVLFVDEIHRMSRTAEEILYPALEDFRIDIVDGRGRGGADADARPAAVHAVGATTRTGLLTTPLRDRFGLTFRLDYYDPGELGVDRPPVGAHPRRRDRRRSRPRRSRGARAARRGSRTGSCAACATSRRCATRARSRRRSRARRSTLLEIDEQGLEREARELLRTIVEKFDGGPVGLSTLAASLGEEQDTIEDVYEPYLLQLGFIQRTPRGRTITKLGRAHVGAPPAAEVKLF